MMRISPTGALRIRARSENAFTILEITLTVFLLALLSTVALFSFQKALLRPHLKDVISALRISDRLLRENTHRGAMHGALTVDLEGRTLSVRIKEREHSRYCLPSGFKIVTAGIHTGELLETGKLEIPYTHSRSPSYHVVIETPQGDTQVVFVAGLSGQVSEFADAAPFQLLSH